MKLTVKIINELKKKMNIASDSHIVGIRGCSSSVYGEWVESIDIKEEKIDHVLMNCLFIVIDGKKMLPLNGSTTPHDKYLRRAKDKDGKGANQLELGFYKHYVKGIHNPSPDTSHAALRQTRIQPVRRSRNNAVIDSDDYIQLGNFNDNIHAAWANVGGKTHASAGCQVIAGYPDCKKRSGNTGHWKLFHDYIYSLEQISFNYLLIPYRWIESTVNKKMSEILIFGSEGDRVRELQARLRVATDGQFGKSTFEAVLKYQKKMNLTVDGIVGYNTLKQIGMIK